MGGVGGHSEPSVHGGEAHTHGAGLLFLCFGKELQCARVWVWVCVVRVCVHVPVVAHAGSR